MVSTASQSGVFSVLILYIKLRPNVWSYLSKVTHPGRVSLDLTSGGSCPSAWVFSRMLVELEMNLEMLLAREDSPFPGIEQAFPPGLGENRDEWLFSGQESPDLELSLSSVPILSLAVCPLLSLGWWHDSALQLKAELSASLLPASPSGSTESGTARSGLPF